MPVTIYRPAPPIVRLRLLGNSNRSISVAVVDEGGGLRIRVITIYSDRAALREGGCNGVGMALEDTRNGLVRIIPDPTVPLPDGTYPIIPPTLDPFAATSDEESREYDLYQDDDDEPYDDYRNEP